MAVSTNTTCPHCGQIVRRRAESTVTKDGKHRCPKCRRTKPVTAFPTRRRRGGVERDFRACRLCLRETAAQPTAPARSTRRAA